MRCVCVYVVGGEHEGVERERVGARRHPRVRAHTLTTLPAAYHPPTHPPTQAPTHPPRTFITASARAWASASRIWLMRRVTSSVTSFTCTRLAGGGVCVGGGGVKGGGGEQGSAAECCSLCNKLHQRNTAAAALRGPGAGAGGGGRRYHAPHPPPPHPHPPLACSSFAFIDASIPWGGQPSKGWVRGSRVHSGSEVGGARGQASGHTRKRPQGT